MPRTYPLLDAHVQAVIDMLDTAITHFTVTEWFRPLNPASEKYLDPPYGMVRDFPSAAEMDGPLDDSQADINLRVQFLGVGDTAKQARVVRDIVRPHMQRGNLVIVDRFVMDIRLMVVSGGVQRDNDLPTPLFYAQDLYEIRTTPA